MSSLHQHPTRRGRPVNRIDMMFLAYEARRLARKLDEFSPSTAALLRSEAARFAEGVRTGVWLIPCAACDRGDFQSGHAEGCPKA